VNPFATPIDTGAVALGAAVALAALLVVVRAAGRLGLADDGTDAPERKSQRAAVPLAGGPALALAAIALVVWPDAGSTRHVVPWFPGDPLAFERGAVALALAIAFATGLVDDVRARGLKPAWKLLGQSAAGVALTLGLLVQGEPATGLERALLVLCAVAAQNVANAFDHADGTLGTVAFLGCASAGTSFLGALAAFLGFNLARPRRGGPPYAFLGDSGSHLLGILLVTSAVGAAALTLPALDLARVVALRLRAGQPVWHGDRRHLGQRLQAAGRGPIAVVALVSLCAAPAFVALGLSIERVRIPLVGIFLIGAAGSAAVLALVLWLHPEPAARAD